MHRRRPESDDSLILLKRAQDGDRAAYDDLFDRFYGRVLRIVRARLGGQLRETLESGDVVHDAMVEAVRSFDDFEIRDNVGLLQWFARIVENRIRNSAKFHRAAKRDRRREVDLAGGSSSVRVTHAGTGPSPLSELAKREDVERLAVAIQGLSDRHQTVIRLREGEALGWTEVAQRADLASAEAARKLYARALVALTRALAQSDR